MLIDINLAATREVTFEYYRAGVLYYNTYDEITFGVPIEDLGNSTVKFREKGVLLMRYMRKHNTQQAKKPLDIHK